MRIDSAMRISQEILRTSRRVDFAGFLRSVGPLDSGHALPEGLHQVDHAGSGNDRIQHNRRSGRVLGTILQLGKVHGLVHHAAIRQRDFDNITFLKHGCFPKGPP